MAADTDARPGGGAAVQDGAHGDAVLLSVIVVNWKVHELLRNCLRSLLAETGPAAGSMQVIVVDNDSGDGSVEMVRAEFPAVHVVANDYNAGFGRANNQALPLCQGRYVCLLNPDTVVVDRCIERCLRYLLDHPDAGIVAPRLANPDGSLQRWTGGAFPNLANVASHHLLLAHVLPEGLQPRPLFLDRDVREPRDVDWVSGACMLLRRDCFGENLFDERFFMYGEDMELCHRVRRGGWRVVYYPVVSIVHYQGSSMRQQTDADVLASALKGPRRFYAMIEPSRTRQIAFDLLPIVGFFARWVIYSMAAPFAGNPRIREQAVACRSYLASAIRALRAPR